MTGGAPRLTQDSVPFWWWVHRHLEDEGDSSMDLICQETMVTQRRHMARSEKNVGTQVPVTRTDDDHHMPQKSAEARPVATGAQSFHAAVGPVLQRCLLLSWKRWVGGRSGGDRSGRAVRALLNPVPCRFDY